MTWLLNPVGRLVEVPEEYDVDRLLQNGFALSDPPPKDVSDLPPKDAIRFHASGCRPDDLNADGYGRATMNLWRLFKQLGYWPDTQKEHPVRIIFHYPLGIRERAKKPKKCVKQIGITMWETTKLPPGWAEACNTVDHLFVPSQYCKEVFISSGVTVPVDVIQFPIDTEAFSFKKRSPNTQPFTFLQYAEITRRKGWHLTLQAFLEEFSPNEHVRLIFKSRSDFFARDKIQRPKDPRIKVICESWPQSKMIDLLHKSDCFVNPSLGEGYGMTDMEAMATGIPTISTYAHSTKDHINDDVAYCLKNNALHKVTFQDMASWPDLFKNGDDLGNWYLPDVNEIRHYMREAFENRQENSNKGERAAKYIRDHFSFEGLKKQSKKIMEKLYA